MGHYDSGYEDTEDTAKEKRKLVELDLERALKNAQDALYRVKSCDI
ncbi:hypothetical protein GW796_09775 [archaeon]|nr:hypothetical protein [archaeon]